MRILFFDSYAVVDGVKSHVFTAGRALLEMGHEVMVALSQSPSMGAAKQATWCGFPQERVRHSPGQDSFDLLCDEWRPDLVDMQHPGMVPKAPVVLTIHTPRFVTMHSRLWDRYDLRGMVTVDDFTDEYCRASALVPVALVRNMIALERFPFSGDPGEGVCFVGRMFDELLSVPAREQTWCPIDFYGKHPGTGASVSKDGYHRFYEAQRTEEVLPRYRIAIAASQCAVEAMAMGRLVMNSGGGWAPGSDQEADRKLGWDGLITQDNIADLMTWNYRGALGEPYQAGRARTDLERALAMPDDERLAITRWNRAWIEQHHDMSRNARELAAFYERAAA